MNPLRSLGVPILAALLFSNSHAEAQPSNSCKALAQEYARRVQAAEMAGPPSRLAALLATGAELFPTRPVPGDSYSDRGVLRYQAKALAAATALAPIPVIRSRLEARPDYDYMTRLLRAALSIARNEVMRLECRELVFHRGWNMQWWKATIPPRPKPRPMD